jgi:hypothetical protein
MVLLKIHSQGVAVFPFKRDAPRSIDRECEAGGLTLKLVESPSRQVQLSQVLRLVECRKPSSDAIEQVGLYPLWVILVPELREAFVLEAPDHLD